VSDDLRAGLERKHSIERGNAVNLSRSNVQPQRDIVEGTGANPADAVVDGMKHRQQAMPLSMGIAVRSRTRLAGLPVAALPARFSCAQIRVDSRAFFGSRLRVGEM
jgi:hypothetical protein